MIILNSATVLRITTSSTAGIDVSASWADLVSGTVTPEPLDTKITTISTTTIVPAPASGKSGVKSIIIQNIHSTTANTVTVERFNGSTATRQFRVTLAAGEALIYSDAQGWQYINAQGMAKTSQSQGSSAPVVGVTNLVVLAADVINNNATANTIANVTGLSFPVVANGKYWFEIFIDYTAAATTTGSRWAITGPAFTQLEYTSEYALTTTTKTVNNLVAYDQPVASNASSANTTGNHAWISGFITPSANGDVQVRFASEIANSAITAKAGSVIRWMQVA
jgi:hypothetical protein